MIYVTLACFRVPLTKTHVWEDMYALIFCAILSSTRLVCVLILRHEIVVFVYTVTLSYPCLA